VLNACATKFDVTKNLEFFFWFLGELNKTLDEKFIYNIIYNYLILKHPILTRYT